MKREFSAGGIVFNNQGQVIICQPTGSRYWMFPKGKIDPGESSDQTALREVEEETGVKAEIITKIGDSKYLYTRDGQKTFKVVTIFLMKYLSGDVADHDWEMEEVIWVTPEQALQKLSFNNDKQLLKKALSIH